MSACRITSQLELVKSDITAYRALERYHYRDGALGPYCAIYALAERCLRRQKTGTTAGVIVYAPAPLNCAMRDAATGGYFAGRRKAEKLALLNAYVRRISRVIIEPRYRGLGLATRLVRDTLPRVGSAMVEASAAMGHLHPFFERAGMRPFAPGADPVRKRLEQALIEARIDSSQWIEPAAVQARLEALSEMHRGSVEKEIQLFLNRFGRRRTMPSGPERMEFVLNRLAAAPMYYAWLNPDRPAAGLRLA
jgi:GNAT superfamily N-acetyltransferase